MPHRASDFRELCALCKEFAEEACLRCGRPLCTEHIPEPNRRCDACEDEFLAETEKIRARLESGRGSFRRPLLAWMLGLLGFALVAVGGGQDLTGLLWGGMSLVFFGAGLAAVSPHTSAAAQRQLAERRGRFLSIRAPRQLPEPD